MSNIFAIYWKENTLKFTKLQSKYKTSSLNSKFQIITHNVMVHLTVKKKNLKRAQKIIFPDYICIVSVKFINKQNILVRKHKFFPIICLQMMFHLMVSFFILIWLLLDLFWLLELLKVVTSTVFRKLMLHFVVVKKIILLKPERSHWKFTLQIFKAWRLVSTTNVC